MPRGGGGGDGAINLVLGDEWGWYTSCLGRRYKS